MGTRPTCVQSDAVLRKVWFWSLPGGKSEVGSSTEISAALAQTSCAFVPASLSPSTHVALAEYHRATERGRGLQVTARGSGNGSLPPPGGELFRQRRKNVIPTGSIHTFSGDFAPCHCRSSCFRQAWTSSTQTPVSCCVCFLEMLRRARELPKGGLVPQWRGVLDADSHVV